MLLLLHVIFLLAGICASGSLDTRGVSDLRVLLFSAPDLTLNISFVFHTQTFAFSNMKLIHPVVVASSSQSVTTTFHQIQTQHQWATVTLLPENRVLGLFSLNKGEFTVELDTVTPVSSDSSSRTLLEENNVPNCNTITHTDILPLSRQLLKSQSTSRTAVLVPPPDEEGKEEPIVIESDNDDDNDNVDQRRRLDVADWKATCYPHSQRLIYQVFIGIVLDRAFHQRALAEKMDPLKLVEVTVAKASAVYMAQMNIELVVGAIVDADSMDSILTRAMRTPTCKQVFDPLSLELVEQDCCDDGLTLDQRLLLLKDYIGTLSGPRRMAHWHLFTDCHPSPGFVGRSYIGTLCHSTYPVGLTSFGKESTNVALWRMFAHELGHAFNASHSFEFGVGRTGGIMDYGTGKYLGEYQFHYLKQPEVCSELASQVHACLFLQVKPMPNLQCGDGLVTHEEECDCGNPPSADCALDCDVDTCKLKSACVRTEACCSTSGLFSLAHERVCQDEFNRNGVCVQGMCQTTGMCPAAASAVCEAVDACKVSCGSDCTLVVNLPDGVSCDRTGGVCKQGSCVPRLPMAANTSSSSCRDSPALWWDRDGPKFSCSWYAARPAMCASYGFKGRNFHRVALEACCACGGGESTVVDDDGKVDDVVSPSPSSLPTPSNPVMPTLTPSSSPLFLCPKPADVRRCRAKRTAKSCKAAKCFSCAVQSKEIAEKYGNTFQCVPTKDCQQGMRCGLL